MGQAVEQHFDFSKNRMRLPQAVERTFGLLNLTAEKLRTPSLGKRLIRRNPFDMLQADSGTNNSR